MSELTAIDYARDRCGWCRDHGAPEFSLKPKPDGVGGFTSGPWVHHIESHWALCAAAGVWEAERLNDTSTGSPIVDEANQAAQAG